MDIVFIKGLRIETVIGIYDWEKAIRQPVVLDIEMGTDVRRGATSDKIEDALDYKAVSKRLKQFVSESRFELVETLAERCAAIILEEFSVPWVRLSLNKIGAVTDAEGVGVIIERMASSDSIGSRSDAANDGVGIADDDRESAPSMSSQ
ncbi:dihydroneopterin aldolase [Lamprobacter modestohalophilus]|uniref:7,8-dihydroneopterin aldolase n=1 Tax=Lamprobacter modestohalophilus TaxID=1064514 RepID=A0A9X0WCL1_9GAMM|nr:dihydroneopterin aldolase [Lamprobacter modestohalophilus]MBK1621100.1 dihydroneopterin aldolase [Lamprobacter modestohalophilus]